MNAHPQRRELVETSIAVPLGRIAVRGDDLPFDRPQLSEPAAEVVAEAGHECAGLVEVTDRVHEVELGEVREPLGADHRAAPQPAQQLGPALSRQ